MINRWSVTGAGYPEIQLYAQSETDCRDMCKSFIGEAADNLNITLCTDMEYLKYIEDIKNKSDYIAVSLNTSANEQTEIYETTCYLGKVKFKLFKSLSSDTYYNYTQYQLLITGHYNESALWDLCSIQDFYINIILVNECRYEVYSYRRYGQSKLKKPDTLKGIKSFGKACYIRNHCNPQLYIKDNDLWVKHTDYFSPIFKPPADDRVGECQNYYLNKYFCNTSRNRKFVYEDNYASIVLRNEAWIIIRNFMSLIRSEANDYQIAEIILKSQSKHIPNIINNMDWRTFWQNVIKVSRTAL